MASSPSNKILGTYQMGHKSLQTSIITKEWGMITKNKNSNKNRAKPTASKIINQHEKTGQDN
jgi:hypothetical protein